MSVSLSNLIRDSEEKYKLKLTAGGRKSKNVTWIYYSEDIKNAEFIKGGELVITTGMFVESQITLYDFIYQMILQNASGMILNIGRYLSETDISEEIKSLCEAHNFALYTMPWEIHIADITKDLSVKLLQNDTKDLSVMFIDILENNNEGVFTENSIFGSTDEYRVIVVSGNMPDFLLYNVMSFPHLKLYMFKYNNYTTAVVNGQGSVYECRDKISAYASHMGISSVVSGISALPQLYLQALQAVVSAEIDNKPLVCYDDMGIARLIFAVKDREILKNMYTDKLRSLEEYDVRRKLHLTDTLFYYLKTGGSLSETAKQLYTHRNTIGYRMNKIRELTGADFDEAEIRYNYLTAIYIKKIIEKTLEAEYDGLFMS